MVYISGHCLIRNEYNSIFSLIKSYEISTYGTSWNKYMDIWIIFIDQFYATCVLEWSYDIILLLLLLAIINKEIFSLIKSYEISTYGTSWNKYMDIWIIFIDQFYATCVLEWSYDIILLLLLLAIINKEKKSFSTFLVIHKLFYPPACYHPKHA